MNRPPVIAVLGHIDHGKSTLLDYIRKTNVVAKEAGGITQHVSAYEIDYKGKSLTFIDTPGHEAFSTMRERGAAVADIAILVVSAEDGVKPQTLEAKWVIDEHKLPHLVAINKIDKPGADLERAKQSLLENSILLEGLGGDTPWVAVSAKSGKGIDDLLDLILLLAEMIEGETKGQNQREPNEQSNGFVLEAKLDPKIGALATVIVRDGTLRARDYLCLGSDAFRIRKLENFLGQPTAAITAGRPAVVLGWSEAPATGDLWKTYDDRKVAEAHQTVVEKSFKEAVDPRSLADQANGPRPLIIKADTLGTFEAVTKEVEKLNQPELQFQIAAGGVGNITENDVRIASATPGSIIVGFNVAIPKGAKELAEKYETVIRNFKIIYELNEWLKDEVEKRMAKDEEILLGTVKILKIFGKKQSRQIVGGLVTSGTATSGKTVRIKRGEKVLGEGRITELKQLQTTKEKIEKGNQCGLAVDSPTTMAVGDYLEILEIKRA